MYLFGSQATGKANNLSDIDLGILCPIPVPAEAITAIREALDELPLFYPIDVVDMATVSDDFKKNAMQTVEYLN